MMNDLEMNELISSVIYDSDNISPVVSIKDGTGETVTVAVDLSNLLPGADVFVDGRLFSKSDQNEWYYSIGLNPPIYFTDREVANIIHQLGGDKAELSSML